MTGPSGRYVRYPAIVLDVFFVFLFFVSFVSLWFR